MLLLGYTGNGRSSWVHSIVGQCSRQCALLCTAYRKLYMQAVHCRLIEQYGSMLLFWTIHPSQNPMLGHQLVNNTPALQNDGILENPLPELSSAGWCRVVFSGGEGSDVGRGSPSWWHHLHSPSHHAYSRMRAWNSSTAEDMHVPVSKCVNKLCTRVIHHYLQYRSIFNITHNQLIMQVIIMLNTVLI